MILLSLSCIHSSFSSTYRNVDKLKRRGCFFGLMRHMRINVRSQERSIPGFVFSVVLLDGCIALAVAFGSGGLRIIMQTLLPGFDAPGGGFITYVSAGCNGAPLLLFPWVYRIDSSIRRFAMTICRMSSYVRVEASRLLSETDLMCGRPKTSYLYNWGR